jgi:transposase
MKQKKAYKYRFYPSDEQQRILAQTFGCCRYVYNWALRERTDAYYQHGERLYYEGTAQRLVLLKKQEETKWLNEVSSVPLQQALRHLDQAFRNFFEGRAEYPTFKKKRHQQAATYASNAFSWNGHTLALAKMDAPLSIVWHRPLPDGCKPRSVTITKDEAERYFVSILVEVDIKPLKVTPQMVGLDLGLKSMVITSDGHTHGNPKFFAKDEKKLAKAQRRLEKKKKGSKNRKKARLTLIRRLPIDGVTINISSRLASYAKTKSYASRVCKSSTWSKTTVWRKRSVTSAGLNLSDNWSTKPHGMGVPWSRLTSGTPLPNAALTVVIFSTRFPLMYAVGRALNVASSMTVISMPQRTFWPRDSRLLPVERP